jgi:integrase/ribosomal protein L37E
MLIKCAECGLQISDKAITCPHCGYPLDKQAAKRPYKKQTKRKRLPNGFGQISEIKNQNLRKPFRVMVTVGRDANGKYIQKTLKPNCYFETYNEAYTALIDYHRNPYDLDDSISVAELYERWTTAYFQTLKSDSSRRTVTSAWSYCSSVYNMRAADIRARHIKGCIDDGKAVFNGKEHTPTASTKSRIKSIFNLMFDYALEYEIVDRNYARTFNLSDDIIDEKNAAKRSHIPYTSDEMKLLWDNLYKIDYVDVLLIQCYSGWRPQELGLIRLEDVDLDQGIMTGGMKTKAGTNRIVPIHPKIKELVKRRYDEAKEIHSAYLINCTDATSHKDSIKMTYDKYSNRVIKIRDILKLNPDHRAHDGRNHFITMAKNAGMDEYALKYIVGHAIQDVTERVYTQREISWLIEEMQKIK